jgi:hypothetical protein
VDVSLYSLFNLGARLGESSTRRPGRFTPGKDAVPTVQEAGQAPGPVWTGAENLAPTGIRSPDCPACSKSLYRLSYPAHLQGLRGSNILTFEVPGCFETSGNTKAGNTLSSRHVGSRDVTSAVGIFNIEFWRTITLLSLWLRHVI